MVKDKNNPVDPKDKVSGRVAPEIESDAFSKEEQDKIVRMVTLDADNDTDAMSEWIDDRVKDLQMYDGEKPSIIENLTKEEWMSDRNLGLCAATCDAYQATLLSTCYNPDTLHFQATEENDVDNSERLEDFAKWGLGKHEADFYPHVDDFIHNRITNGVSYFKISWKVWYEWVDRRIPKYDKDNKFKGYDIKTEHKRFEKGVIENIHDCSDILFPVFGSTIQDKAHVIHLLHMKSTDAIQYGKDKVFLNVDDEFVNKLKSECYDKRLDLIGQEKSNQLGLKDWTDIKDSDLSIFPLKVYEWYGKFEKNGRLEEYRFRVEPLTKTFLSGKPLRKITRSGKRPIIGGPFIRRPGKVRGKSLPRLIQDPCNAINNVYNQKSDFQFVENCPFGFYTPDEAHTKQVRELIPGTLYPTEDPNSVVFPNLSRSTAWATNDIQLFFEILERQTGAASYFMSNNKGVSGTATRDAIINEKSETRFGLWVKRIIDDVADAISLWINMYQDWAPTDLGSRVLGEDGSKLFDNLSIETLRGNYKAYMTPDIVSGSKTLEKEIALWAFENLQMSPWFNPQINPKGSWDLVVDTAKKVGLSDIESMMPPKPKGEISAGKSIKKKFDKIKQGEIPEIEETDNPLELFMGFQELRDLKYNELDPEYKPLFDNFMFTLYMGMLNFMQQKQQEQMANKIASDQIRGMEKGVNNASPVQRTGA